MCCSRSSNSRAQPWISPITQRIAASYKYNGFAAAAAPSRLVEFRGEGRDVSDLIWGFDELVRFSKWEDAEVRYWAIDRLIRHYPETCCDAISGFVLDDHDVTPERVARHLGEHGTPSHHAILLRGFKLLRGTVPGHCLQALARLGYPGTVDLAATVLHRGDLNDAAVAISARSWRATWSVSSFRRRASCSPSRRRCAAC
jgi:hypothetical protein